MKPCVLLDTGPLVAFLNRRDHHHLWTTEMMETVEPPLIACEAVLSEACFLLRTRPGGQEAVMSLVERGLLTVPFRLEEEITPIKKLMSR